MVNLKMDPIYQKRSRLILKIQNNEDEILNYWWSEGFTDYYSRVLSLRSGEISIEEFISEVYLSCIHGENGQNGIVYM